MPIDRYSQNSPRYFEPDEGLEIVKYVDIVKFLSIIKDKSLFFCRVDKLEDKFEGTFPILTHKHIVEWTKYMRDVKKFFKTPLTDEQIEESATDQINWQSKLRALMCVNCWNVNEGESYALWKIYAGMNQGIMLKTNFKKLIHSFRGCVETIYCSKVKYIDYEKDYVDFGNTIVPFIHKHYAYTYEKEIRLLHEVAHDQWTHDWESEKYKNGIMIPVDLTNLFDSIIISPFSPNWFKPLVEDLATKYDLNCDVTDSKLR